MKFHNACIGAAAVCLPLCAARLDAIKRLDGTTISKTEAAAFAQATLTQAHVMGAEIAILDHGRLVWSQAFGLRRRDPDLPMKPNTNTWAASISKSVFATYVMKLVERGEFSLDIPVAKQLSQPLDAYEPYRESASVLVHDAAWPTVTPRMLLAHSSGLLNFATIEPDKKMRLHFAPGTQFWYSGEGINIVQFMIEQQKKRPLNELMQDAIFGPLGMTNTGIIYREEFASNVADRFDAEGKFHSETKRYPARAAGSMATSVEDLALFTEALLADKILKPATRKEMFKPFIQIRTLHEFPRKLNEPESEEARNVGLAYSVGWGLLTHTRFGPAFFKEGHGDGAQNYMICFERRQACMILLTNSDNGERAFQPLLTKLFGDTVTPWEWEGYPH
jgi:CubicO group peptidase (beta-lactamase class C family)